MDALLNRLYYNPDTGFTNATNLLRTAKRTNPNIRLKQVQDFLKRQRVNEDFKKFTAPKTYPPLYGSIGHYQMDLTFLPNYTRANQAIGVLVLIGINSKKAYAVPVPRKDKKTLVEALENIIGTIKQDGHFVAVLQCDQGGEFINRPVKQFLKDAYIELIPSSNKTEMGVVERFNRTLKAYLNKWFQYKNTTRWVDVLPRFIDNYNRQVHASTGFPPDDITEEQEMELIFDAIEKSIRVSDLHSEIQVGAIVRIRKTKGRFEEGATVIPDLYQVIRRNRLSVSVKHLVTGEISKAKIYNVRLSQADTQPSRSTHSRNVNAVSSAQTQARTQRTLSRELG